MPALSIRGHAWAVAVLVFAAVIAGDAVRSALPCRTGDVIQKLQFSDQASTVESVAPQGSKIRAAAVTAQRLDSRVLVPAYWLLFTAAALLLWRTALTVDHFAGTVVIVFATAAALLDLQENRVIVADLEDGAAFRSPVFWAKAKWAAVFFATLGLSLPFLARLMIPHQSRVLAIITGTVLLTGGLIGVSVWRGPGWVAAALSVTAIGMLLMALLFLWDPRYLNEAQDSGR
jgi:hypothetical protein